MARIYCFMIGKLIILAHVGAIDYKWTFAKSYEDDQTKLQAYSDCHTRSAIRVLGALLANGGKYYYPCLPVCLTEYFA